MSPEQMKARVNEIAQEAYRRRAEQTHPGHDIDAPTVVMAVELALSGWTPPPKVSPRVLAAREWLRTVVAVPSDVDAGRLDQGVLAESFLAGFKAAEELAKPLVKAMQDVAGAKQGVTFRSVLSIAIQTYHQAMGEGQ